MIVEPFKAWWCCLRPNVRNLIVLLIGAWFTNSEYITRSTYSTLAVLTGNASPIIMGDWIITHYGLTEGIVLDAEDNPIQVLFFDLELWAAFYIFSQTDEFICPGRCKLLVFPA